MTAGYSGKLLATKLGLKSGTTTWLIGQPEPFPLLLGDSYGSLHLHAPEAGDESIRYDYIPWFVTEQHELVNRFAAIKARFDKQGMLWISWPKRGAPIATDMTEEIVRQTALLHGIVDVKVCAIDTQ